MSSLATAPTSSHWLYFLAGALLPTIAYSLGSKSGNSGAKIVDDDDEDLDGVDTTGPSSKWGLMHGPYKVRDM